VLAISKPSKITRSSRRRILTRWILTLLVYPRDAQRFSRLYDLPLCREELIKHVAEALFRLPAFTPHYQLKDSEPRYRELSIGRLSGFCICFREDRIERALRTFPMRNYYATDSGDPSGELVLKDGNE